MIESSPNIISSITVILITAGAMGAILSYFRLPGVLAFIITGILIGPGGLGWVSNTEVINSIAELGIIFLLFVLGAELTLPRIKEMRVHAIWAGVLQLALTIPVLSWCFWIMGLPVNVSLFLAGALALSSTAIALKMLDEQGQLDTVHGRIAMGILIVQDLALVPLMTFMPLLTGEGLNNGWLVTFGWVLLKAVLFLGSIVLICWKFMPRVIDKVAAVSSKEIFAVFVVAFGLVIAVIAEFLGLSYAVGAFIAGLSLSQTVTSRQIVANSLPFRDIFSTVFFVTVGMLMNTQYFMAHVPEILGLTLLISAVKMLIVGLSVYILRFPLKTVLWGGFSLFQVGEFSFILLQTGLHTGTLNENLLNSVTSAIILSMLATPLLMRIAPHIIQWIQAQRNLQKPLSQAFPSQPEETDNLVVVAGYGPVAKNLIQVLKSHEIDFKVIEMNIHTVKKLQAQGIDCVYGDVSDMEVLQHADLHKAKAFAITIPDIHSAELALQNARKINPDIYCIIRSRYQQSLSVLFRLGADEVVYEEFETSMSFVHSILDLFGDHITDKESYMLFLRENRRSLLQMGKHADDTTHHYGRLSIFKETKIEWIAIPENSALVGMTLAQAGLRQKTGVNVLSLIHPSGQEEVNPPPETELKPHQVLVVIGSLDQLQNLEAIVC